jgi:hypothetical protein
VSLKIIKVKTLVKLSKNIFLGYGNMCCMEANRWLAGYCLHPKKNLMLAQTDAPSFSEE